MNCYVRVPARSNGPIRRNGPAWPFHLDGQGAHAFAFDGAAEALDNAFHARERFWLLDEF